MRLRPLAGAEKLNQRNGWIPVTCWLTDSASGRFFENVDEFRCRSADSSEAFSNNLQRILASRK
jgi:hypothetical protein